MISEACIASTYYIDVIVNVALKGSHCLHKSNKE